jgi:hypothetical protein
MNLLINDCKHSQIARLINAADDGGVTRQKISSFYKFNHAQGLKPLSTCINMDIGLALQFKFPP